MFHQLKRSKRGISEVLASVIIIALVVGASAIVGLILINVEPADLPWGSEETGTRNVEITLNITGFGDVDNDTLFDQVSMYLSLSLDSPDIYVQDIDLLLPTGHTLDEIAPWTVESTSQLWLSDFSGFYVENGTLFAEFTVFSSDLTLDSSELEEGDFAYLVINYIYIADLGAKLTTISDYYQSSLLTFV